MTKVLPAGLALGVLALVMMLPLLAPSPEVSADTAVHPQTTPPAGTPTPEGPVPAGSSFRYEACAFEPPADRDVACGYLTVPAHRDGSGDGEVRLQVAIVKARGANPAPDPVLYLAGGPGENALQIMGFLLQSLGDINDNRDIIFFDQRGAGFSEPALECPELDELTYETLDVDLPDEEALALELRALEACRDRLVGAGANLSAPSTKESAADVRDLRTALGIEEWNLLGISYGTRLALAVMAEHPEGIRSVILDSTYPLDANLYEALPGNMDRAFGKLIESCAADDECSAAYPDLGARIAQAYERLEAEPVETTVVNPATLEDFDALIDGDAFVGQLFQALYATDIIPSLPEMVQDAAEGDVELTALLLGVSLLNLEFSTTGMQMSVQCQEDAGNTTEDRLRQALDEHPRVRPFFQGTVEYGAGVGRACEVWDVGSSPLPEPPSTDVPTLVMAGEFDPITPPEWGRRVAERLPNAQMVEFPGYGHGAVTGACGTAVAASFLDDPSVEADTTCVQELAQPDYVLPLDDVELVGFEEPQYGIQGVRPEDWQRVEAGLFQRSALGETTLVHLGLRGVAPETYLSLFLRELGVDETPEPVATRSANGAQWDIYEIGLPGVVAYVALAAPAETTLVIVAAGLPGKASALREHIFYPAVDALKTTSGG